MDQEEKLLVESGVVVPESVLLMREKLPKYGTVPGLDEDELADPDELERQVIREEFEPVLLLPHQAPRSMISPTIQDGEVDWGAFGTIDFDRYQEFDKARYKADKLREELRDLLIRIDIAKEHVPAGPRSQVLRYLHRGVIELEHITDFDMYHLATLVLRAKRLQDEIRQLKKTSWERREKAAEAWLAC